MSDLTKAEKRKIAYKQYVEFHKYMRKKFNHPKPFKDEYERWEFVNKHVSELTQEEKEMFPDLILDQ